MVHADCGFDYMLARGLLGFYNITVEEQSIVSYTLAVWFGVNWIIYADIIIPTIF
jgi:hypothetical protein